MRYEKTESRLVEQLQLLKKLLSVASHVILFSLSHHLQYDPIVLDEGLPATGYSAGGGHWLWHAWRGRRREARGGSDEGSVRFWAGTPGTISGLEPFDILYWAGIVPGHSRPEMLNRTGPKGDERPSWSQVRHTMRWWQARKRDNGGGAEGKSFRGHGGWERRDKNEPTHNITSGRRPISLEN